MPAYAFRDRQGELVLNFTQYVRPDVGSLAILLAAEESRCGIYWLTFDDGTEYVGQSIRTQARLGTHRRHQPGVIKELAFAPVPRDDLDRAERALIEHCDREGVSLRNKLITRRPGGPEPLVVTVADGYAPSLGWDRDQREQIPAGWESPTLDPTALQAKQWETLRQHDAWPDIRRFLRAWVRETLSSPHLTGGQLWTVSAMPHTAPSLGWRRLCTVNVGRIEALYIGQDEWRGTVVQWNVAVPDTEQRAALRAALRTSQRAQNQRPRTLTRRGRITVSTHEHYSDKVMTLNAPGPKSALRVLALPVVADLAYQFNTHYQRQGMALQRRWHNPLLAADLLAAE